jgi:crotonobetainyl-CoA:carnitine CoA-transferase CaiB-like acyl-CoA transferase
VPCGAINNLAEVFADPQVQAREMAVPVPHPLTDALKLVASPIKMSATPPTVRRAPPLLGEHTQEVLATLDDAPLNTPHSP